MKKEVKIHQGYKEFEIAKNNGTPITQLFGKYQYIFSSDKGTISLIQFMPFLGQEGYWEIYCLHESKTKFFEDTERFASRILAELRVGELLE